MRIYKAILVHKNEPNMVNQLIVLADNFWEAERKLREKYNQGFHYHWDYRFTNFVGELKEFEAGKIFEI